MKILACGDIHNSRKNLELILNNAEKCDYIILNGDITNFGNIEDYREIEKTAKNHGSLYINWGNCDTPEIIAEIENKGGSLDGKGYMLEGNSTGIFGLSGSNITPLNTCAEYSEQELYDRLVKGFENISGADARLLFSHVPPYGTRIDRTFFGLHAGSKAVRRFLENYRVELGIFSHIHEASGSDRLASVPVYNIGAVRDKRYAIIRIAGKKIDVELYRL